MSVWLRTLVAVGLVCLVPLVATMLLAANEGLVRRLLPNLLSFGVGVLVASAVLHLLPESLAHQDAGTVALVTVLGFASLALVERLLEGHDHGHVHGLAMGVPHHEHAPGEVHVTPPASRTLLPIAFGADVLHNFLDGVLIAATFLVRPEFGLLTALAIGLHELPRELGTFGLFVHGGLSPRRAVLFNALTAVFAMAGAVLTLLLGRAAESLALVALPFAAGTMLYIAMTVGRAVLPPVNGVLPVRRVGWLAAGGAMVAGLVGGH
ncbi:MAG: ZIP family metal transporter [Candidatus Brachytrichaceae bacterium NZ_4S206]|jgi:zinc and cadmium transporter